MAVLLYDNENYSNVLNCLKCSNNVKEQIKNLVSGIKYTFTDKESVKLFLHQCDITDYFEDLLNILETQNIETSKLLSYFNEISINNECYRIKDLKINGNDLLNIGIKNENIGKTLKFLLKEVIKDNSKNSKDALIKLTESM